MCTALLHTQPSTAGRPSDAQTRTGSARLRVCRVDTEWTGCACVWDSPRCTPLARTACATSRPCTDAVACVSTAGLAPAAISHGAGTSLTSETTLFGVAGPSCSGTAVTGCPGEHAHRSDSRWPLHSMACVSGIQPARLATRTQDTRSTQIRPDYIPPASVLAVVFRDALAWHTRMAVVRGVHRVQHTRHSWHAGSRTAHRQSRGHHLQWYWRTAITPLLCRTPSATVSRARASLVQPCACSGPSRPCGACGCGCR
jgi:hypothetical protein